MCLWFADKQEEDKWDFISFMKWSNKKNSAKRMCRGIYISCLAPLPHGNLAIGTKGLNWDLRREKPIFGL
ncbi:hypothetical protein PARA125_001777 [Parachlamydia sp. AcF125]|nr:hypothetical protein [Parachlamydia sp. AcF125]